MKGYEFEKYRNIIVDSDGDEISEETLLPVKTEIGYYELFDYEHIKRFRLYEYLEIDNVEVKK